MSDCEKRVPCDCNECSTFRRGIAEGERRERARVVAFLKDRASEKRLNDWYTRLLAAEEIQRGEHESEGA